MLHAADGECPRITERDAVGAQFSHTVDSWVSWMRCLLLLLLMMFIDRPHVCFAKAHVCLACYEVLCVKQE